MTAESTEGFSELHWTAPAVVTGTELAETPADPAPARRGRRWWSAPLRRLALWLVSTTLEVQERELDASLEGADSPSRSNRVAFIGPRGGTGKTSLTLAVGSVIARQCSGLTVVALDADADYGGLSAHAPDDRRTERTINDLLADFDGDAAVSMPCVRPYLSRLPSGLNLLAAPKKAGEMRELTAADLDRVLALLGNFDLVMVDCAAGVTRDLAPWAIERADRLVVVTTAEQHAARNVAEAIKELPLDRATLAVNKINPVAERDGVLDGRAFARLLPSRLAVGHDEQLHAMLDRARLDVNALRRATRLQLKQLAVVLVGELR